jgi:hypothetical protein
MGHVTDASLAPSRGVYGNHYSGCRVKATRWDIGHWRIALIAAWEQSPKSHKFQEGTTLVHGRQPGYAWSRYVSRWPEEFHVTWP